jgi:alkanesulfonate monooxygenase SsuD/methylene tetrahydromethanopterin reductase-like flavin-dependent oxidoreductase (luciferase family)
MRIGIQSAQAGPLADPAAVRSIAVAAEQLGYSSLWMVDRLGRTLDPVAVMAAVAAVTSRVRIGSSVLVAPWYPPALLARSLTTLDILSGGRLQVGLGTGVSGDERRAVGVPDDGLGDRVDAVLDELDARWGPEEQDLRPVQRPRPPVLLAAYGPLGLDRTARRADGWNPAGLPLDVLAPMWDDVRRRAEGHGRDPDALDLVVRADVTLAERPFVGERPIYHGTVEQVVEDLVATRDIGAHEVVVSIGGDLGVDQVLDACARIAEGIGSAAPVG